VALPFTPASRWSCLVFLIAVEDAANVGSCAFCLSFIVVRGERGYNQKGIGPLIKAWF
jgi:hypothetical protein